MSLSRTCTKPVVVPSRHAGQLRIWFASVFVALAVPPTQIGSRCARNCLICPIVF
jgi:hypothetical protein